MGFGAVVLCLVCPSCGRRFDSAMQMEPRVFEQIRLDRPMECCPHCGDVHRYSKRDYLFRSSTG
jgi:uncharacterized Zn-finger protein